MLDRLGQAARQLRQRDRQVVLESARGPALIRTASSNCSPPRASGRAAPRAGRRGCCAPRQSPDRAAPPARTGRGPRAAGRGSSPARWPGCCAPRRNSGLSRIACSKLGDCRGPLAGKLRQVSGEIVADFRVVRLEPQRLLVFGARRRQPGRAAWSRLAEIVVGQPAVGILRQDGAVEDETVPVHADSAAR